MQNRKDFTSGFSPLLSRVVSSKAQMRFTTLKSGITKRGEQTVTLNAKSYIKKVSWGTYVASCALILTSFSSFTLDAYAERAVPKKVVQNRKAVETYEWTLSAGSLPLDAFKKGITAGGSLTIHRDHLWAWEAISAAYSFEFKTALEDELRAYKLQATPFERVKVFATSNLVFKPLYWKGAWLNEKMAYGELFFIAGGGYGWLTQTSRPVVNGGLGIKLIHDGGFASRLDVRMMSFFNADDLHNELWVNLGFSL